MTYQAFAELCTKVVACLRVLDASHRFDNCCQSRVTSGLSETHSAIFQKCLSFICHVELLFHVFLINSHINCNVYYPLTCVIIYIIMHLS